MEYTRLSDANVITEKYMDSILIEERLIDSVVADTSIDFLGAKFDSPIMTPAFSHLGNYNGREYTGLEEYSMAAKECNILNFCGMMENDQFKKIADTGAKTVRIVKPYADNGKVKDQMQYAESVGAFGIGMDIDHIFGHDGLDVVVGEDMAVQTMDMLRSYVELTKLGDSSLKERYGIIKEQKQNILEQIEQFQYYLKEIEFKEWYYETALKEGTEKNMMERIKNNPSFDLDEIPKIKGKKK